VAKKLLCHPALPSTVNEATSADRPPARDLQVLILEPDEKVAREILSALEEAAPGTRARTAQSLAEAQRFVIDQKPVLFVLDVDATYDMAQEFIYDLRTSHPTARAIILTATHFSAEREQVAGLGAIHFLEKPFPRADFITLAEALLLPTGEAEGTRFQGTLSDLHIADIVQLKCISGATSMLEFTGPRGEKARVYFENGQVRHATAPGKEGMAAFNEIVDWKGGLISEVPVPHGIPRTIDLNWQVLLMEAVRQSDESRTTTVAETAPAPSGHKILVIDDSVMLLSFVKEMLDEQGYDVVTAETGEEGLKACRTQLPDLILLDFVLPDMKGDEVCRRLMVDAATAKIPVIYVSGFGSDLQQDRAELTNLVGSLNKPFTSESLIDTVRSYFPATEISARPAPPAVASEPVRELEERRTPEVPTHEETVPAPAPVSAAAEVKPAAAKEETPATGSAYFCGSSSFFSLHRALQTIAREKLTGILSVFWSSESVELLARDGQIVTVTTRDPTLYCEEAPVTLLDIAPEQLEAASARQAVDGCPIFLTLAEKGQILPDPALELVQHHGRKLFSQLWTERIRFVFVQELLPDYASELVPSGESIDQWALSTLRFVQYQAVSAKALANPASIPAYTLDGYERMQQLRLTDAEAQFASQFNGRRSLAQISKNLRLDIKFARLTLFRFLTLEIVECWPAQLAKKPEGRGPFRGIFNR
jgi:DNA-binding response OmpR family regulator